MNPLRILWRFLVFKIGDTRWLGWKNFPAIVTWDANCTDPKINGYEVADAAAQLRPGDIIILRHENFLSNIGIGGAMIHAALYVGNNEVIEALSDDQGGVVKRHVFDTLRADKALVLRPDLDAFKIVEAVGAARTLEGFLYDIYFDFNTEEEQKLIARDAEKAKAGAVRFCCTEIPHYCYLDHVEELQLYRTANRTLSTRLLNLVGLGIGGALITADMYVEANFKIVWASAGCTEAWFRARGCSEKFLARFKSFKTKG